MKSCLKCATETCLVACISSGGEEGVPGRCPRGFWWLENQGRMHTLTPYHLCPQPAAPLGKKTGCYFSNQYVFFFFSLQWMRKEDTSCQPGRHFRAEQERADLLLPSNYLCPNCRGFISASISSHGMKGAQTPAPWRTALSCLQDSATEGAAVLAECRTRPLSETSAASGAVLLPWACGTKSCPNDEFSPCRLFFLWDWCGDTDWRPRWTAGGWTRAEIQHFQWATGALCLCKETPFPASSQHFPPESAQGGFTPL